MTIIIGVHDHYKEKRIMYEERINSFSMYEWN